jgi:cytochrome c oxidase subunit 4
MAVSHARHDTSPRNHLLVFAGLMLLTFLTYWTGKMHLGRVALPLALVLAATKAGLVIAFFMHLAQTRGAPLLAMSVCVIFILALLALVFGDVAFRFPPSRPDRMGDYAYPAIGDLPAKPRPPP